LPEGYHPDVWKKTAKKPKASRISGFFHKGQKPVVPDFNGQWICVSTWGLDAARWRGEFPGIPGVPRMEWHWVMQFLWKNSTGTIPAIFKLYGSMGFKQPQKKTRFICLDRNWMLQLHHLII